MSMPITQERLLDERQIERVLIAYCRGLDTMELDALALLFTEDCLVSYGPDAALNSHGRDGLRRDLGRLWRWRRTAHHLSNVEIDFTAADRASVSSAVMAWHERADGGSDLVTATVFGRYEDEFVRTGEGWLIAKRTMYMSGSNSAFKVNLHPLPRRPPPPGWTAPVVERRGP
jgi:SnoaL-like domain